MLQAMATQSSDDEMQDSALAGCLRAALARGSYAKVDAGRVDEELDEVRFARRPPRAGPSTEQPNAVRN